VDFDTITLLLGMMIVVASLRLSGFFAVANAWVGAHARRPLILLGAVERPLLWTRRTRECVDAARPHILPRPSERPFVQHF
jgi:hypothetical protein